jgi:hypothetical protein
MPVFKAPEKPIITTVTGGTGQLTVAFTAPAANGSPIIGYKYVLNGGVKINAVLSLDGKSVIITKNVVDDVDFPLIVGTPYNVQLCATNILGDSELSVFKAGTAR